MILSSPSSIASTPPPPPRVRPPLLAASFLLVAATRSSAAAASAAAASSAPHGHAPAFSAERLRALVLTQPLQLHTATAAAAASSAARGGDAHTSLAPFSSSSAASSVRNAAAAASAASVDPRDVQMEVGCSLALLRAHGLISGSLVELEPAAAAAASSASAGATATTPRVLARIQAVEIEAQQFRGKRRWKAECAASAAAAAVSAASTLLIPPSLHFHLFAATAPAAPSSSSDANDVRIRKFLPPVPGRTDGSVHTLRPDILTWLPTAAAVSVARIATPASSSAAYASSDAQLSAVFTRTLADGSKAPRRRIMFAGASTIIAVPLSVRNRIARNSWLLRPPPGAGAAAAADGDDMEDEMDDEDESMTGSAAASDASEESSGHFLPPSIMRLLYFRITSVTPALLRSGYFVIDPNVTTLVQEGSVRARVDYASEWFLTRHAQGSRREQLAVPSPLAGLSTLRDTFDTMRALFLPSLLSSSAASTAGSSSAGSGRALPSFALASSLLLTGPRRSCKRKLASAVACSLGVHYLEANFFTLLGSGADESAIRSNLSKLFARAQKMAPCVLHLRRMGAVKAWLASMQKEKDVTLTAALRELMESVNAPALSSASASTEPVHPVLVLGSCETLASMPASLRNLFLHSLSLTPPSLDERRRIVSHVLHATAATTSDNAVVPVADAPASKTAVASSSHSHDRAIDSAELAEAAAEVNSIVVRSQLTASPPAPSAAPAMDPRALAQTIAEKSAGMSVGDVEHFVAAIAKHAVERQMREEDEARADEKKRRAAAEAAQRKAAAAGEDDEERKESDAASMALLLASSSSPLSAASPTAPPAPLHLTGPDIDSALSAHSARASASSGTMSSAPNVKWSDVGGLENVKREVMESIELPLKFPELFKAGIKKRAGILLYGPPGTGKTMIAKAVATECRLNFMSVKGPELLNMYIGESEANIRAVFRRAREARPVVVFFDELDALAPARGQGSDSGGVMDRVVSALLAELDSGAANQDVFVIAATNRPDLIEAGLLRPGRLDRCVYLGVSSTHEQQVNILRALTRKFHLAPGVDLEDLVEPLSFTMSGADFYALASDAMLNAMKRKIAGMEIRVAAAREEQQQRNRQRKQKAGTIAAITADDDSSSVPALDDSDDEDDESPITASSFLASLPAAELVVLVTQEDFIEARDALKPSLDQEALDHYAQLQAKFSQNHAGGEGHASSSSSKSASSSKALVTRAPEKSAVDTEPEAKLAGPKRLLPPVQARPAVRPAATASPPAASDSAAAVGPSTAVPTTDPAPVGFNPMNEWERGSLRKRMQAAEIGSAAPAPTATTGSFSAYAASSSIPPSAPSTTASAPSSYAAASTSARRLKPWEMAAAAEAAATPAVAASAPAAADPAPVAPTPTPILVASPAPSTLLQSSPVAASLSPCAHGRSPSHPADHHHNRDFDPSRSFNDADGDTSPGAFPPVTPSSRGMPADPLAAANSAKSSAASSARSSTESSDADVRAAVSAWALSEGESALTAAPPSAGASLLLPALSASSTSSPVSSRPASPSDPAAAGVASAPASPFAKSALDPADLSATVAVTTDEASEAVSGSAHTNGHANGNGNGHGVEAADEPRALVSSGNSKKKGNKGRRKG